MSQAAVERRRKVLGFAAGVGLTLIGMHHIKAAIGTAAKVWLSVGYGLTGAIASGKGEVGPFRRGFRAGAAVTGAVTAFQAGYAAGRPQYTTDWSMPNAFRSSFGGGNSRGGGATSMLPQFPRGSTGCW